MPARKFLRGRVKEERVAMEQINERHPHRGDWLREIVFGLNDGLVTTLVFIMAVSTAAHANLILIVLGEVLAGGISMALGGYLSARTAKEVLDKRIATERSKLSTSQRKSVPNYARSTATKALAARYLTA